MKEPTDAQRADYYMACLLSLVEIILKGDIQAARDYAAYVREAAKDAVKILDKNSPG